MITRKIVLENTGLNAKDLVDKLVNILDEVSVEDLAYLILYLQLELKDRESNGLLELNHD